MAKPRIFVSSTYYDLKHIRSSLDNFIESLGFEPVLSEKGDIAYSPDSPLDESCYKEAKTADIFVILIGGRYGSGASSEEKKPSRTFFERYDSVTKKEYDSASSRDIPIYILVEQNVHSEYQTYLRNKDNTKIQYAHVDSINVFHLIEEILSKPRNNPVHTFERFSDIESWLREQWSGLFKDLLQRLSSQKQISTLSSQVEALATINSTLQRYLEEVVMKVSPENAAELIEFEQKRIEEVELLEALKHNDFYNGAFNPPHVEIENFKQALLKAKNYEDFAEIVGNLSGSKEVTAMALAIGDTNIPVLDINEARKLLGKEPFPLPETESRLDQVVIKQRARNKKTKSP